jgi:hypothetical protein
MIELRLVGKRRHDEQAISTYMLGEEGRVDCMLAIAVGNRGH